MVTNTPLGELQPGIPKHSTRIESLDVLRGIAVSCALLVSIWIFGGFGIQKQHQLTLQSKGWDFRLYETIKILFDGKMRAIIAIVFGASMFLFLSKKNEAGKPPPGDVFINRQLWLIFFGLINALVFLWTNDVLFHLGVMGVLLFPFVRFSNRVLLIAAIAITLIYCGKNYWNYADDKKMYNKYTAMTALAKKFQTDSVSKAQKGIVAKKDTLTKLQVQDTSAWTGRVASMKVDLKKDTDDIKKMTSVNYGKTWNYLVGQVQWKEAAWTYQIGIWDFGGMIVLGILLFKIGFFSNNYPRGRYLLLGLVCLAGGLFLGWLRMNQQQLGLQDYTQYISHHALPNDFFFPIERVVMALGYMSFIMLFLSMGFLNGLWKAFACIGKLSLTNYLMQSIICTLFFYGYGMGYYGKLSLGELYIFTGEVLLFQVVFSVIWLRHFNYGPAEWLLRRLSSGRQTDVSFRKPSSAEPAITVV